MGEIDKRLQFLDTKDYFMTIDNPPIIMISDHNESLGDPFAYNSSFGPGGLAPASGVRTVRNAGGERAALSPLKPLQKGRGAHAGTIRSIEISSNN